MGRTGKNCSKFVLFGVNVVFCIIGLAAAGVCIAGLLHLRSLKQSEDTNPLKVVIDDLMVIMVLGIAVGSIVTLISCCGCCGAALENKCILMLYVISLMVLICVSGFAAYKGFTLDEAELKPEIQKGLNLTFSSHPVEFILLESQFECCGVKGASDYSAMLMPSKCCAVNMKLKGSCPIADLRPGCTEKITTDIMQFAKPTAYAMVGLCVFELLMIISAFGILTYEKSGRGTVFAN